MSGSLARRAVLLLALLLPLAAPGTLDGGQEWGRFENRVSGHSVRVPPGWHAVGREDGATIVTSFDLPDPSMSPGRIALPRGGVYVWIFDWGGPLRRLSGFRAQERLRLEPASTHACGFGYGRRALFRVGGHGIHAFVRLGPGGSARTAVQILRSFHLTPRAAETANERSRILLGRSHGGRPIRAWRVGNPRSPRKILVVGCIHGDECAGTAVTQRLVDLTHPIAADLWVVQNLNPDGLARRTRYNARGVDLNRNFPSEWRRTPHSGARPLSEREARIAYRLVLRIRPHVTIWFHQPQALVRAWGPSIPVARRYARLAGEPYRSLRWPPGTAPNWQNHRFPAAASFVVELSPGPLSDRAARRHVAAILGLAQ